MWLSTAPAMAAAIGCSERDSSEAAISNARFESTPLVAVTAARAIRPSVMVPVLSRTTWLMRRVDSRASPLRIRTPSWAPRPVPTMIAVGVASPSAHGQAMTKTATAALIPSEAGPPKTSQLASVTAAATSTIGTKTAEIRSARCCTGAVEFCASSTRRIMRARVVSVPTRVASITRDPCPFNVAPLTTSPTSTSTGTGSPVSIDSSTVDIPSTTRPSTGT